jgi:DNA invertase Pin-like site-specific DNA recombinase
MTDKVKLFSYARFSSDKQKDGDSIHRQLGLAEEFVATHPQFNFELINEYQDDGLSAHHGRNLTVGRLGEFLSDVKAGHIDKGSWLGIEDFDRLSRQNYWTAKNVFEGIINAGITVVTFRDGKIFDLPSLRNNPFDFMMSLMQMVGANEYTERMSHRSKKAWQAKREAAVKSGKVMSANVPSWINTIVDEVSSTTGKPVKQHFELHEVNAEIVRQVCDMFLKGSGPQTIARQLNLSSIQTLRGGKYWGPANVRAVLRNPALCGRYEHWSKDAIKPDVVIESYYPPLVPRSTYDEITLLLSSNNNAKPRPSTTPANPLQGLCHCSICGALMTRVSQRAYRGRKPYEKLVCIGGKTGKHKYRSIDVDHVMGHLNMLFEFPTAFNPNSDDPMTPLLAKKSEIERRIERLTSAIAAMGVSDAIRRALTAEEANLAAVDKLIQEEASKAVYGDTKRMAELTTEVRQAVKQASTDAASINGLLRRLFKGIKIDIEAAEIWATWMDGRVSVLTV